MCTDGRIRLFWGVSPDVMALALRTSYTLLSFQYRPFCVTHAKRTALKRKIILVVLLIYLYIYIGHACIIITIILSINTSTFYATYNV